MNEGIVTLPFDHLSPDMGTSLKHTGFTLSYEIRDNGRHTLGVGCH